MGLLMHCLPQIKVGNFTNIFNSCHIRTDLQWIHGLQSNTSVQPLLPESIKEGSGNR